MIPYYFSSTSNNAQFTIPYAVVMNLLEKEYSFRAFERWLHFI